MDHNILFQKLEHYGFQGRELTWFKSYLSSCKQYYSINGVESELLDNNIGVPQGSCLGPLLFLLYISDLPQAAKNSTVAKYSDDASISYGSDDIHLLKEAMNKDFTTALNG